MKKVFLTYDGDCISADNSKIIHRNKTAGLLMETDGHTTF
jgi:hypothetical protein